MRTLSRLSLVLVVAGAAVVAARAQSAAVVTPELILTIAQAVDAQLSPDGATVVYQVSRPRRADEPFGAARSELWIVPAAGGEPRRLTQAEDRLPRWSPDGKRVAFIGRRGDQTLPQIQIIEMAGGEARPLTNAPSAVSSFKWSPDGRMLAYTYTESEDRRGTDR